MKTSKNLTPEMLYTLTLSGDCAGMRRLIGKTVTVDGWARMESPDSNGEIKQVVAIATPDGCYATNGKAFVEKFDKIIDFIMAVGRNDSGYELCIKSGKTRAGREYVTCELKI